MSRLEEIKRNTRQYGKLADPPVFFREVDEDDWKWLIQQAERVQVLEEQITKRYGQGYKQGRFEEQLEAYENTTLPLLAKNQRYKQALEFYADEKNYDLQKHDDIYDHYFTEVSEDEGEKARQALEVSE